MIRVMALAPLLLQPQIIDPGIMNIQAGGMTGLTQPNIPESQRYVPSKNELNGNPKIHTICAMIEGPVVLGSMQTSVLLKCCPIKGQFIQAIEPNGDLICSGDLKRE